MKKKLLAAVSLVLGTAVLATGALANYSSSNGYDVLKKSVIGTLGSENYTMKLSYNITTSDGKTLCYSNQLEQFDKATGAYYNEDHHTNFSAHDTFNINSRFANDNFAYYAYSFYDENDEENINAGKFMYNDRIYASPEADNDPGLLASFNDNEKAVHFAELLTDTMVGDLKNNFTLKSKDDNGSTYEIKLSSVQIPELVNAGSALLFGNLNADYSDESSEEAQAILSLGDNPSVSEASLVFSVDKENNFKDAKAIGVISGNGHSITVEINVSLSDVGTTVPQTISDELKKQADEDYEYYNSEDTEAVG